jgi:nucleoside-diphosphate-sugar epimerase
VTDRVALIMGATGIVGHRLVAHLAASPGWRVIGLSRRGLGRTINAPGVEFLQVDLRDQFACRAIAEKVQGITHVFNAARFDHETATLESPDTNTEMLANVLDALAAAGHPLEHVHIVQGTKYYGSHLGPFATPAKETDPRSLQSNFYYKQEDLLIARRGPARFSWSASRPHAIVDPRNVAARSIPVIIAIYAALSKELGLPLCFPGTEANFRALYQFTDAGLLARAIEWMATTATARDQAFNVTNGDYIRWCNLWPRLASYFGMQVGQVRTVRLESVMADKASIWTRVVERYGLMNREYGGIALWAYGDFVFTPGWDIMSSVNKVRAHGFHDSVDTESMLFDVLDDLRSRRLIPPE